MKKILYINTTFEIGGAAKTARQLFDLCSSNSEYAPYFAYGRANKNTSKNIKKFGTIVSQAFHLSIVRLLGLEGFGSKKATKDLIQWIKKENFDLIHIHNLHGYYLNFFSLIKFLGTLKIPIIWTLHDEWALTGLPGFSTECEHCLTGSGKCTNIYAYPKTYNKLFYNFMLKKKQAILTNAWQPTLVCPSQWLANRVDMTPLRKFRKHIINTGIDTSLFKPRDKTKLRAKHNLPLDKKIVLFNSANIKNKTKGIKHILDAAKKINDDKVLFVGTGKGNINKLTNVKFLGYVDETTLAELYSLSDLYIFASLAENCPAALLEAMASETPIVAFDIPPTREILGNKAGVLVEPTNTGIIKGINKVLNSADKSNNNSRDIVINKYDINIFYKRYLDLYESQA